MRHLTGLHFLAFVCSLLTGLAWTPALAQPVPQAPQVPVRSYILQDFNSGAMLAGMNPDEHMEPASITKLMTGYVIYKRLQEGAIQLTDPVTISEKAWRMEGSRTFVEVGTQVPVETLIMGMVVQSGNDATVALAEHVAGTEQAFAELMNQHAAKLGLANSHFMNTTGLPDPNHYTSARDIATLVRALIEEFPDQYAHYAVRSYAYHGITQHNRNRLLWQDPSVDGVKTGHTSSAGYCLATSARRGDMRLISVVFGAKNEKDRFAASQALLNYGFGFFETHKLYDAGQALTEARIYKGEANQLPLGLSKPLYVTIPKGRYKDMNVSLQVSAPLQAPAQKGAPFGSVVVTLGDETISETPLVALQDVPEAGLVGRLVDEVRLMFHSMLN